MIDLHCHILPNVDDGAGSVKESVLMAMAAVKDGIHTIVATPHTLNEVYLNPVAEVTRKVAALQQVFLKTGVDARLYPGADVHLCPNLQTQIEQGNAGTINNAGKYILLELPSQTVPERIKDTVFALKLKGITPIITHPERNTVIQHDAEILYELVCMGVLSQVTAMSLTGDFGSFVQHVSEELVRYRLVHVIASDAHSSLSRPPVLSQAVEHAAEILGNYEEATCMVSRVPEDILSGKPCDIAEPINPTAKARAFGRTF